MVSSLLLKELSETKNLQFSVVHSSTLGCDKSSLI